MNTQFRKGVLEMCIIGKISLKDMYGYQIVQEISNTINVSESTVYPILQRLTKEGIFSIYYKESNEGPRRKYFKLTDVGKNYLNKLLTEWYDFVVAVDKTLEGVNINE